MADFDRLVKAYDIRGTVPDEMNAATARDVGALFVRLTGARRLAVARDMRDSSPALAAALAEGAASAGADVLDAGLGSTDYAYYVSGALDIPAAMITASHNPAAYNGIKLCRAGAAPVGEDTGLAQIRAWLASADIPAPAPVPGTVTRQDLRADYARHLRSLVPLGGIRPLKVVADAGNGMAGHMVPVVLAGLPVDLIPLYFELDGAFPNHEANPLEPKNLRHYYFRDFWRADTGMLTALHILAALGTQDRPLSELTAAYSRYTASGEINSHVDDVPAKLDEVDAAYARTGVTTDRLDGLTVNLGDGRWFNLRPSNTEPLLRLNVEAPSNEAMITLRDEVLALVR